MVLVSGCLPPFPCLRPLAWILLRRADLFYVAGMGEDAIVPGLQVYLATQLMDGTLAGALESGQLTSEHAQWVSLLLQSLGFFAADKPGFLCC